jgi:flagellar hook assembly protein FlgD
VIDGSGNPADTSEFLLTMRVEQSSSLRNVVAFPNPFPTATDLTFNLTGQNVPEEGSVRIYTVAGRLIREVSILPGQVQTGFNRILWDGRDAEGDEVANGVYLAVVKIKAGDRWLQETAKLAKAR